MRENFEKFGDSENGSWVIARGFISQYVLQLFAFVL
jgi:hypothetical protein